ncbi:MAG: amidohydrolase family protein [Verrucomicrobia bacterium]|nr:amidohydrolase family protein [Verrucomicrobiota bacterium]
MRMMPEVEGVASRARPGGSRGWGGRCGGAVWLAVACLLALRWSAESETLLLLGATVHPVTGPALTNGAVYVRDGTIEAVAPALDRRADRVERLDGLHLYPGLVVAGTQLGLVEIEAVRATRDTTETGEYTPDVESWAAVNPDSELIPVARANGITHIVPVPSGGVVAGQSGLLALKGWTTEEMMRKRPVALHVNWPSLELEFEARERAGDRAKGKSLAEQAQERRKRLRALQDFFEEARAYARAKEAAVGAGSAGFRPVPAWEAMLPFVRGEAPLFVHADEVRQIEGALGWAETNRWKMVLVGARDAWRVAERVAAQRVPVLYGSTFDLPAGDAQAYDVHYRAPGVLHRAGVMVAFAAGGRRDASNLRNLPYEAAQAMAFGLPAEEALRGLTLYPARLLGVADRLGSIEPGKEASFFAADGPILDVRAQVRRLWIAGEEVSLETRHTRLYEKYRGRPRGR